MQSRESASTAITDVVIAEITEGHNGLSGGDGGNIGAGVNGVAQQTVGFVDGKARLPDILTNTAGIFFVPNFISCLFLLYTLYHKFWPENFPLSLTKSLKSPLF